MRIGRCQDDDVQEDTDDIDGKGDDEGTGGVLVVEAPEEGEQEEAVVHKELVAAPTAEPERTFCFVKERSDFKSHFN